MIKAVLFDCFGLLCEDGWLPFRQKYFPVDNAAKEKAVELNDKCDAGEVSYDDFVAGVAELAGIPAEQARQEIDTNPVNEELLGYIRSELLGKYKIGLLSNAGDNWLDQIFGTDMAALFDSITLSCDIGYIKPQPESYQLALKSLGVDAGECVFIDDQPRYCEGAEKIGLRSINHTSNARTITELNQALGIHG